MTQLAVTVLGHDRPGIIADVTGALAELGGNLEDSSMTLLRGHFAWTLIVAGSGTAAEVDGGPRAPAVAEGLVVSVLPVPEEPSRQAVGQPRTCSPCTAPTAPASSRRSPPCVAEAGGNITDLTTRLGGGLYLLVAEVELPAACRRRGAHRAASARRRRELGRRGVAAPAPTPTSCDAGRIVDGRIVMPPLPEAACCPS